MFKKLGLKSLYFFSDTIGKFFIYMPIISFWVLIFVILGCKQVGVNTIDIIKFIITHFNMHGLFSLFIIFTIIEVCLPYFED